MIVLHFSNEENVCVIIKGKLFSRLFLKMEMTIVKYGSAWAKQTKLLCFCSAQLTFEISNNFHKNKKKTFTSEYFPILPVNIYVAQKLGMKCFIFTIWLVPRKIK